MLFIYKLFKMLLFFVNCINFYIILNLIKFAVQIKRYDWAKNLWKFYSLYFFIGDEINFHKIFSQFIRFFATMLLICFISGITYFIFLMLIENFVFETNFYACNKAFLFFIIYGFVYILIYEDDNFSELFDIDEYSSGILDYDENDDHWEDLNYEIMEDFEVEPEEPFIDLEEDIFVETELDDTENEYIFAEIQDDSFSELDDNWVKEDLFSNLYFFERWLDLSVEIRRKYSKKINNKYYNNLFVNFLKVNQIDLRVLENDFESNSNLFCKEMSRILLDNVLVSDSLLLSLYIREDEMVVENFYDINIGSLIPHDLRTFFFNKRVNFNSVFGELFLNKFVFLNQLNKVDINFKNRLSKEQNLEYFFLHRSDVGCFNLELNKINMNEKTLFKEASQFSKILSFYFEDFWASNLKFKDLDEENFFFPQFDLFRDSKKNSNEKSMLFLDFVFRFLIQNNVDFKTDTLFVKEDFLYNILIYLKIRILYNLIKLWQIHKSTESLKIGFNISEFRRFVFLSFKNIQFEDKDYNYIPIYLLNREIKDNLIRKNLLWHERKYLYQILLEKSSFQYFYQFENDWYYKWLSRDFNLLRRKRLQKLDLELATSLILSNAVKFRLIYFGENLIFWLLFGLSFFFSRLKSFGFGFNVLDGSRFFKNTLYNSLLLSEEYYNYDFFKDRSIRNVFFPYFFSDVNYLTVVERFKYETKLKKDLYVDQPDYNSLFLNNILCKEFDYFNFKQLNNDLLVAFSFFNIDFFSKKYAYSPVVKFCLYKYIKNLKVYPFFYEKSFISNLDYSFYLYKKILVYKQFWDLHFSLSNFAMKSLTGKEEDLVLSVFNKIWHIEYLNYEEQFEIEFSDDALGGMGGIVVQEENGDMSLDEFEVNWDWTILNWHLISELYYVVNGMFQTTEELESELEYNYYIFIFCVSFIFWFICKVHRFATYDSDAFVALIPFYKSSRFSDLLRVFIVDYYSTPRNTLMGDNFVGETNKMFWPPYSIGEDYMKGFSFPRMQDADDEKLQEIYQWVETTCVREDTTYPQYFLVSGLFGYRRPFSFFQNTSLMWMKHGRLHRQMNEKRNRDVFEKNKKLKIYEDNIIKELQDRIRQRQHDFTRAISNLRKSAHFVLEREKRHAAYLAAKKAKRANDPELNFLNTDSDYDLQVRLLKAREYISPKRFSGDHILPFYLNIRNQTINWPVFRNIKFRKRIRGRLRKKKQIRYDIDLGPWMFLKQKNAAFLQNLSVLNKFLNREALKLFIFGPDLKEILDLKKKHRKKLTYFERYLLIDEYVRKVKGLQKPDFFSSIVNHLKFSKTIELNNPSYIENVLIRLFLYHLKKSNKLTEFPPAVSDPDVFVANKYRYYLKSLSFHSFFMNTLYYNKMENIIRYLGTNNIYSHYSGLYGGLLKNYIQYRYDVRFNFIKFLKRFPVVLNFVSFFSSRERDYLLDEMGVFSFLYKLVRDLIGEEFLQYNFPYGISRSFVYKNNKFFFNNWYNSVFKNPYLIKNKDYFDFDIRFKNNRKSEFKFNNNYNLQTFLYSIGFYNDWENFLGSFPSDSDIFTFDDQLTWGVWYERSEYKFDNYSFFLGEQFFLKELEESLDGFISFRNILRLIHNSSKINPYRVGKRLFIAPKSEDSLFSSEEEWDLKNFEKFFVNYDLNLESNTSDYPSNKIIVPMYYTRFVNSLFSMVSNYNWSVERIYPSFISDPIRQKFGFFDLFLWFPIQHPSYTEIRLFEDFFELKRKKGVNSFRDFRKVNFKDLYYEGFFNLARQYMDYHLISGGINRRFHLGSHLILPFNELYPLDELASPGSTQHRWYLGSLSEDILGEERRYLFHNSSIIWPHILRSAQDLPIGDSPEILISLLGGLVNSNKLNAFGYTSYNERLRRNVNSDIFGDFGFEDLSYPPDEDTLGYVNATTTARFLLQPFFNVYHSFVNRLPKVLDQIIRPLGGHFTIRPSFFRRFDKYNLDNRSINNKFYTDKLNELFNSPQIPEYSKNLFRKPSPFFYLDLKGDNSSSKVTKILRKPLFEFFSLKLFSDENYFHKLTRNSLSYIYSNRIFYFPLSLFYGNSFTKAGTGFLSLILIYLFIYYFIWVPWMYFFFSINSFFDTDFGKEDIPIEESLYDLQEIEAEEAEEYSLGKIEREPIDTSFRHAIVGNHIDIADLLLGYYDHLKFDYTSLLETPYFFVLKNSEISFYSLCLLTFCRNELFDLSNLRIYSSQDNFSFDIFDVINGSNLSYLLDGFRLPSPQYRSLYTEFISFFTSFEHSYGDVREEYLDLLVSEDFFKRYPTPSKFDLSFNRLQYLSDGYVYYKARKKKKKKKRIEKTQDQLLLELGRFSFNDPFKTSSLRHTMWMSTKLLLDGFISLGIDYRIYQNSNANLYILNSEKKILNESLFLNEFLCIYPKGYFGMISRDKILQDSFQYRTGELLLPSYLRFFRSDDSYNFNSLSNVSDQFVSLLSGIGSHLYCKVLSSNSVAQYVSLHDSFAVTPYNFEGFVSNEMLLGLLYLFQHFISEVNSLIQNVFVGDFILKSHSYELNELYSDDFLNLLIDECSYTFSDWGFFFEESTDWTINYDLSTKLEIEDDFVPTIDDVQNLKDEVLEDEIAELEMRPDLKAAILHEEDLERQEMRSDGYSSYITEAYIREQRRKPDWFYDDVVESLVLITDEDEIILEKPYFPDVDTHFSFYFTKFQSSHFIFSETLHNNFLYNIFFKNNIIHKVYFDLMGDLFLQFITMQFIDYRFLLDPYTKLDSDASGFSLRFGEISSFQNNLYFSFFYCKYNKIMLKKSTVFYKDFNKKFTIKNFLYKISAKFLFFSLFFIFFIFIL